ncbi:MAG: Ni-sirohydrochlorin a,c-diamide synthase [Methanoculleaceae archaeon]
MKALLISGDRSGSGKTSITLAIAALLSRKESVQTYKVGMDYIDPSYLTAVTGRWCRNLDTFVMNRAELTMVYDHARRGAEIALVEGVRGLYEGADPITDTGSTASVAKALRLPVVLVVDCRSITRSAAAIVKGFAAFDPGVKIAGVILNNISGERHRDKAVRAVEHSCGIPVVGAIPRSDELALSMRHLGLVPFREGKMDKEFLKRIEAIPAMIGEYLDLDLLLAIADDVPPPDIDSLLDHRPDPDLRIGIACDEAFNFYYADLFDVLRSAGAVPVPFSPVHDQLPDADGYIIGGGYPELHARQLEENEEMRQSIREVAENHTPIYAECGGLAYLTGSIDFSPGFGGVDRPRSFEMCGVFEGATRMPGPRVLGYVLGECTAANPFSSGEIRGHEFHYTEVELPSGTEFGYSLSRGKGIRHSLDGAVRNQVLASYIHIHPVSSRSVVHGFVRACRSDAGG